MKNHEYGPALSVEPDVQRTAALEDRVSSLELFFDLVFVFTITQLTTFLAHHPTGVGVAQMSIIFGNLWWMFGGYAWLTNAVPPRKVSQQLLILVGMAAFLVVALAVPNAFGSSGTALGVGYFVVTLVHAGLFLESTTSPSFGRSPARGPSTW
jgi:low temperature requirement protein LtrA